MQYFRLKLISLFSQYGAQTLAGTAALLGLAVMLGWHFNWLRIIQILPTSAPMQYNTALAFLCSGTGAIAITRGWRKMGVALAAIAFLLGLLTLLQYLFGINLGLDQLFVQSTLTYKTSHPGRMSLLTSGCFILCGLALGLRSLSARNSSLLISSSLVAVIAALAAGALFVYATGLTDSVLQAQFTRMAVHTATGFLLLAGAIYALDWVKEDSDARWFRQVIVPLITCLLTGTLYFWASLKAHEDVNIKREIGLLAGVVKNGMEMRMRSGAQALSRMAHRWNLAGGTPRTNWEADAADYVKDLSGVLALVWADPSHRVQWVVPRQGNETMPGSDLSREAHRRAALEQAQEQNGVVVSQLVDLFQGGKGILLIGPVFRQGQPDGHLLMGCRAADLLAVVVSRHKQNGDVFALYDEQSEISRLGEPEKAESNKYQSEVIVDLAGTRLRLVVMPGQGRIANVRSSLPAVILWGGLLLSGLTVLLARLLRTSKRRASQLQKMYQQLGWEAEERLQSEERLRVFLEAAPNALLSVNPDGRITLANSQALELFGYSREELLNQPIEMLLPERFRQHHASLSTHFFKQPNTRAMGEARDLYGLHRDGHEFPVQVNLNALSLEDGGAVLVSITDISERKHTEQVLLEAKETAEYATRAKSLFLANMSHEIRTPLNGVIGMTSMLQQTALDAGQTEFVETIRTSGEALLAVINDILDFSKIESGKLDLEEIPFDPRHCADEVLTMLAQRASTKGLELACLSELPPGLLVRGDEARLRQILINLIGNAIKFTAAGEIVVSLSRRPLADQRLELRCAVRDTGIGIPPEKLTLLFESFSQLDASTARQYGGSGLGLAISKRLAEMMGGQMEVESCVGVGSTFFFTIAVGLESAAALPPAPAVLAGKTILIAAAHSATRQALVQQTTALGLQALPAATAQEALALAESQPTHLVLADLALFEATASDPLRARQLAALRQPGRPLIVLVSSGTTLNHDHLGDAKLNKPVKPASLAETLLLVCDPARAAHAARAAQAAQAVAAPCGKDLRILVAEDNPINQRVVLQMLKICGCRADVAGNGLEALAALERQPYDLILMDQMMPELDGLQTTRRIHDLYGNRRPYIIALTANALKGDREACLAAGMDDYLSKPLKLEALQDALRRCPLAGQAARLAQPIDERLTATIGAAEPGQFDLTPLKAALGDNQPELLKQILETYIDSSRGQLHRLEQALNGGDTQTIATLAHTLRGSSGQLGIQRVAALCQQLEMLGKAGQMSGIPRLVTELATELNTVHRRLEAECQDPVTLAGRAGTQSLSNLQVG